jgi:hypothetical protein
VAFVSSASNTISLIVTSGGTTVVNITKAITQTGIYKIAFAYATDDFVFYVNGEQVGTDNSGAVPTPLNKIDLGQNNTGTPLGDGVNQALLFKTRLTNDQLAELTSL